MLATLATAIVYVFVRTVEARCRELLRSRSAHPAGKAI
jgi:hypothetical protein